jgi:dihydroorotase
MNVLIRGGRVLDPANDVDREADILIEEGRIARVEPGIGSAERVIDARNRIVAPGLVDIHVHLRDPGQEHKEDIASGTRAAAAGGFTAVCCMPNTVPVNDNRSVTEYIVQRARELGVVRVYPVGAMTVGLEGKRLTEVADMKQAGIVAVSDDGRCLMDAGLMRRSLEYAATFGLPVAQHCEDHNLSCGGAMHEGLCSTRSGISAQPAQAESVIVARDIELCELTGARYHAQHLSTRASMRLIREAKARGLPVSCEVTPHHFSLTDEACLGYDSRTKVNPPLRSREHVEALREAIADGTVDAIATDHAPHALVDKDLEFGAAAFGISGLETALPLSLELWRSGLVSLSRVIGLLSVGPARLLNLPGGTLACGAPADVTVIDPDMAWTVRAEMLESKGKNTPFIGRELRGAAMATLVGGRVVFERDASVAPQS